MVQPKEDKNCYASPEQRYALVELVENNILDDDFFLTGGTALAVFYLHHRTSNDLDLFTTRQVDLGELDFAIKTAWQQSYRKIRESRTFLSLLLHDVKVDFVIDPLSSHETRQRYPLEPNLFLQIDSASNIRSNKLTALASRTEPKDFVDFYYLCKSFDAAQFKLVFEAARKKDAIFDDPPTAAYQIEQGLQFVLNNMNVWPPLKIAFEQKKFSEFYQELISWIYEKGKPK